VEGSSGFWEIEFISNDCDMLAGITPGIPVPVSPIFFMSSVEPAKTSGRS